MKFTNEELAFLQDTIQVYKGRCEGAINRKLRKNSWTIEDREEVKKMAIFHKNLLEKIEHLQGELD